MLQPTTHRTTIKPVDPAMDPTVAVIVPIPTTVGLRSPVCEIVPTPVIVQWAVVVRFWVDPSLKYPVAVY
jgi:hypothetical protein